jgi:hypothetical protein
MYKESLTKQIIKNRAIPVPESHVPEQCSQLRTFFCMSAVVVSVQQLKTQFSLTEYEETDSEFSDVTIHVKTGKFLTSTRFKIIFSV